MTEIHIERDRPTDTPCKYHCDPTCHPAKIEPDFIYGCLHPAWPANRVHDFCPIVNCGGEPDNCEMPAKLIARYRAGLKCSVTWAKKKLAAKKALLAEAEGR